MTKGSSRLVLVLAGGVLVLASGCPAARSVPQHVIYISLDTTRADHMGFYGGSTQTPNLDRLAAESVVLDDLMSVAPSTLVSHTSLFTGTYPHTHGVPRNGFIVNPANVMLPEVLQQSGFTTVAFIASFALAKRFNFNQGFEHYDDTFERFRGHDQVVQNERSAAGVTDAVLTFLDEQTSRDRLFLFVHYFDPHLPYAAPPPYDTQYDPRGGGDLPSMLGEHKECSIEAGQAERVARQYAGEVSYLDSQIGRLLDGLRDRSILDRALVVITSDHGENFREHPYCFNHGWDTYQNAVHAVGVVRFPGARHAGTRIKGPTSSVDVMPTLLRILDLEAPASTEGQALELDPPSEPDTQRPRFAQATKPWDPSVEVDPARRNQQKARCIRQGKYKLVQTPYTGREELYDLELDPTEQHDLLLERPQEVAELARELRSQLETWAGAAGAVPSDYEREQREETLRRLEALGYVGGD